MLPSKVHCIIFGIWNKYNLCIVATITELSTEFCNSAVQVNGALPRKNKFSLGIMSSMEMNYIKIDSREAALFGCHDDLLSLNGSDWLTT